MLTRRIYGLGTLGLLSLAAASLFYVYLANKYEALAGTPLLPEKPLSTFPMTVGQWQGREVPIAETVLKVAGNDDHLSRFFYNTELQSGASLYIGYTAEPRRMLGHRPTICYVGNGWTHDFTNEETIRTASNNNVTCLINRFYKPGSIEEVYVLNYYVVNGRLTTDHKSFEGLHWRRPKQLNGQLQYVAQVQISSTSEQAVKLLARDVIDPIFEFMP